MNTSHSHLAFSFLIGTVLFGSTIGPEGHAQTLASPRAGRSVVLARALQNGDAVLDREVLHQRVFGILRASDATSEIDSDRRALLASFLHDVREAEVAGDPSFSQSKAFAAYDENLDFKRIRMDARLRASFRHLLLAFLVVEKHRELSSAAENEPLRDVFAGLVRDVLLDIFERRASSSPAPSDAQIVEILAQFRGIAGTDDRLTWRRVIEVVSTDEDGLIARVVKRRISEGWSETTQMGFAFGAMVPMAPILAYLSGNFAQAPLPLLSAGMILLPLAGLGAGFAVAAKRTPRFADDARRKFDALVQRCHVHLVQSPGLDPED